MTEALIQETWLHELMVVLPTDMMAIMIWTDFMVVRILTQTMVFSQTKPDPKNSTLEVSNWEKLGKNLKRMMSFMNGRDSFDYQYFAVIFKDNLGTVYAILESTYRILKGKHFNKS